MKVSDSNGDRVRAGRAGSVREGIPEAEEVGETEGAEEVDETDAEGDAEEAGEAAEASCGGGSVVTPPHSSPL
ncbi:hypothetical protein ACIGO8_16365 [Streptomyces sp. NPDC053493]|uniref:hypothetical protein n=1 Tax=Streptomyces sp. NPDC053493 TaxID=3365705 RepID=UPI0037D622E1